MPEGKLCNTQNVDTEEQLQALLNDKSGKQYYEEMNHLDVNAKALVCHHSEDAQIRLRTWLEICAHCGMCADSCFFYLANKKDPTQVPSYKIQSTLGEIVRRKGNVDNAFMQMVMDTAWSKCTCCNRCGMYCPFGIDMGVMFGYLRGLCYSQGFVPWELKIGSGMHRIYRAQMDVTTEDWVDTCEWMAEEYEEDWPGLEIPVDVKMRISYTRSTPVSPNTIRKIWPKRLFCFTWPVRTGPFPAKAGKRPAWPCLPATGRPARCRWKAFMTPCIASTPSAWW